MYGCFDYMLIFNNAHIVYRILLCGWSKSILSYYLSNCSLGYWKANTYPWHKQFLNVQWPFHVVLLNFEYSSRFSIFYYPINLLMKIDGLSIYFKILWFLFKPNMSLLIYLAFMLNFLLICNKVYPLYACSKKQILKLITLNNYQQGCFLVQNSVYQFLILNSKG